MASDPRFSRSKRSLNETGGDRDAPTSFVTSYDPLCWDDVRQLRAEYYDRGDGCMPWSCAEVPRYRPWWRRRSVWMAFCEGFTIITLPGLAALTLLAWFMVP